MNKKAGIAILVAAVLLLVFYFLQRQKSKNIGNQSSLMGNDRDSWFSSWYLENPLFWEDMPEHDAGSAVDWQY